MSGHGTQRASEVSNESSIAIWQETDNIQDEPKFPMIQTTQIGAARNPNTANGYFRLKVGSLVTILEPKMRLTPSITLSRTFHTSKLHFGKRILG